MPTAPSHPATRLGRYRTAELSSAPLATLRVVVGSLVAVGALRFMSEGWVERLLGAPFRFDFAGLGWVPELGPSGGYALYALIALSGLAVALGYRYRLAAPVCLAAFTLAELQDATHYLNHYYLVVLLLGLLCVVPAGARFSLDVAAGRMARRAVVPAWCVHVFVAQLTLVYFFAGLAKVNGDWLLRAMPLAIWLPERSWWPIVGGLFELPATAFAFSWLGCAYDLTIAGWLLWSRSRRWAYLAVVVFHGLTWLLFNIGLFPGIMIGSTLIFFGGDSHERLWAAARNSYSVLLAELAFLGESFGRLAGAPARPLAGLPILELTAAGTESSTHARLASAKTSGFEPGDDLLPGRRAYGRPGYTLTRTRGVLLASYFAVQIALPLRAYAYPGPVAWGEEGYRFGWRVMLVEKAGQAEFTVVDAATGRRSLVDNRAYLTAYQEKQMAIQPDFVRQFAVYLSGVYRERYGFSSPEVYADVHVSLNGRRSRRLVDNEIDLAAAPEGWRHRTWIEPFAR